MIRFRFPQTIVLLALASPLVACQTMRPRDETIADPDAAIAEIQGLWAATSPEGASTGDLGSSASKDALRRRAESISFQYPSHGPTLMLCAVLAYEACDTVAAQRHLDDLLGNDPGNADAVSLRARIAMEEGNVGYARRLLEDRIAIRPDHGGMRELLGAALYLSGDLDGARASLAEADRLGAPRWRTAYDRGLIAEASGERDNAAGFYREALALKPDWKAPRQRLRGIDSREAGKVASSGAGISIPAPVLAPVPVPDPVPAPVLDPDPVPVPKTAVVPDTPTIIPSVPPSHPPADAAPQAGPVPTTDPVPSADPVSAGDTVPSVVLAPPAAPTPSDSPAHTAAPAPMPPPTPAAPAK